MCDIRNKGGECENKLYFDSCNEKQLIDFNVFSKCFGST